MAAGASLIYVATRAVAARPVAPLPLIYAAPRAVTARPVAPLPLIYAARIAVTARPVVSMARSSARIAVPTHFDLLSDISPVASRAVFLHLDLLSDISPVAPRAPNPNPACAAALPARCHYGPPRVSTSTPTLGGRDHTVGTMHEMVMQQPKDSARPRPQHAPETCTPPQWSYGTQRGSCVG